jgi:hypothetical protein
VPTADGPLSLTETDENVDRPMILLQMASITRIPSPSHNMEDVWRHLVRASVSACRTDSTVVIP